LTEQDTSTEPSTLAEKLDHLFRTVRAPGGREFSHEDVARAVATRSGPTISATYIWQLRRGQRTNPRMSHLHALAAFFGVDPGYFFPGELAEQMEADLTAAGPALRDQGARALAAQAAGLPENTQAVLLEVAMLARRAHGLPALA
jgi:transcriptional regulator with XRE-family HTH domain